MKKLTVLILAGLLNFPITNKSHALIRISAVRTYSSSQVTDSFYKALKSPDALKNMCSKGNSKNNITIFSLNEIECSLKPIAALAKKYCYIPVNNDGTFIGSKCELKIREIENDPIEIVKSLPKSQKSYFCLNIEKQGKEDDKAYWRPACKVE